IATWLLGLAWTPAMLLGFSLALSSTAFVLQLLGERRTLNHPHGRAAFGTLLLQDLAVIPAIAVVNLMGEGDGSESTWVENTLVVLGTLAGLAVVRFSLRPLLRFVASTGIHELFIAAALALVAGAALTMESIGLSMGLGAFAAGMMVADSEYRHQLEADVTPFKSLLLGLFFMAVGMSADLSLLVSAPGLILGLTLALVIVKTVLVFPLALLHGLDARESLRTAIILSQGGEFAFVLLTAAIGVGALTSGTADIAVLVVTLSMASTAGLAALADRLLQSEDTRAYDEIEEPQTPVVIAGFGRVGQIVGRILSMRQIPFTALETSSAQVDFVRKFGNKIYFGDPSDMNLLRTAHIESAKAIVIAVDSDDAAVQIARQVRETCPNTRILARATNRQHELRLREIGVDYVIRETLLSSLELSIELLTTVGMNRSEAEEAVATFRVHDAATLDKQLALYHDEEAFRRSTVDAARELRDLFDEDAKA
ncbi:MAG: cation:proton antiporter, partial [Pseudomonadales bacterium]|nr:cation:proton antiporter [Pseudomonadales bacterium]